MMAECKMCKLTRKVAGPGEKGEAIIHCVRAVLIFSHIPGEEQTGGFNKEEGQENDKNEKDRVPQIGGELQGGNLRSKGNSQWGQIRQDFHNQKARQEKGEKCSSSNWLGLCPYFLPRWS